MTQGVEAVERALHLLEAFRADDDGLGLAELARRSGLNKSTILRLAVSLEKFGYLRRGEDGRYRLGSTLWRLGALYRSRFQLADVVRPVLRRLVERTGETASFYVREGDQRVCLYRHHSLRPIHHHIDEGTHLPLERGASGWVLLAFGGAPGEPSETIRRAGWYLSRGERYAELAALAVPVFGAGGRLQGALAVSGLISRFGADEVDGFRQALQQAAMDLGRALGHGGEPGAGSVHHTASGT